MTPQEVIDKTMEDGAVISIAALDGLELTLAKIQWLENPSRFKWCAIFPEHQSHVHITPYDRIEILHDRDVAFYDKAGEMVAYVCPYTESGLPDEEVERALAEWRDLVSKHNNQQNLDDFFEAGLKV